MKKLGLFIAAALLISLLCGCAAEIPPSQSDDGTLSVVTTIFPPYDFSRALGGDKGNVRLL